MLSAHVDADALKQKVKLLQPASRACSNEAKAAMSAT